MGSVNNLPGVNFATQTGLRDLKPHSNLWNHHTFTTMKTGNMWDMLKVENKDIRKAGVFIVNF